MSRLRLQIRTLRRSSEGPLDELAWCEELVGWVRKAVDQGRAGPAAVVRRPERMDLLALGPVQKAGVNMPQFLACLTRSELPECGRPDAVAVIGVIGARQRGQKGSVPMAVVFVEWPDNRWWHWKALLSPDKQLREDTEVIQSALDGDPLPRMFGRWWSHGRRANLTMRLAPAEQAPLVGPPGMVH